MNISHFREKLHQLKERSLSIRDRSRAVERQVREKAIGYILAGFGVVAGLAWNEAINALIDEFFPLDRGGLAAKFLYAFLMTLVVVVMTIYLMKLLKKDSES